MTATNDMTASEFEIYKILVRLGDTHELAVKTIEVERVTPENKEVYINAYER